MQNLSKIELSLIEKIIETIGFEEFEKILTEKIIDTFINSYNETNKYYNFTNSKPDPEALEYLHNREIILSNKTMARLKGNLSLELLEGIQNKESITQIKKRLSTIFERMQDFELERIARTELLTAMNAGRHSAYEKSGIVKFKMWKAAMNNKRTAADSKRLNGQIQKLNDPFIDPKTNEKFMYPPNRPQCRCTIIPLQELPEIIHKNGLMYIADSISKIEIDINPLEKNERGTHEGYVTVHRQGKVFQRKQRLGRKEQEKPADWINVTGDFETDKKIYFVKKDFEKTFEKEKDINIAIQNVIGSQKDQINYDLEFYSKNINDVVFVKNEMINLSSKISDSLKSLIGKINIILSNEKGRSYSTEDTIVLKEGYLNATLEHEFGHIIENNSKKIHNILVKFFNNRTKNNETEYLKDLFPDIPYNKYEIVKKDKFIHPYIGKIYTGFRSTEILSMGMQYLNNKNTAELLLEKDPEHFYLTLAIMAGRI